MSEIRALLLTDVVDSTQLATLLGDHDMARLWAAHDRVARDLLPLHGGREIDKTDGMLLLFEQAGQALAYARAYHAALAGLHIPLKARAGLHVGPVILRENAQGDVARGAKPLEVEGLAKPTAAHVMALAQGGQTLLSAEARQALGEIVASSCLNSALPRRTSTVSRIATRVADRGSSVHRLISPTIWPRLISRTMRWRPSLSLI